jgi:hypothetical protein
MHLIMEPSSYPKPVADVVAILTDVCRHQKQAELVELLENSHSRFDEINYDNWNGGTTTWGLRLEVPIELFAAVQGRLSEIEKGLAKRLGFLDRLYPNDPIGEVTITPVMSPETALGQRMAPSDTDVRRLWRQGYLRLFVSHVSQHKVQVSKLKSQLLRSGISAFVAHEDIEPSLEWQNEISLALRSMHALVALITPDFHVSNWTDQEIGWALGRGVTVVPVRLGVDPYGFTGKIQAITGSLEKPDLLADNILQALLRNNRTHGEMRRSLVEAFEQSESFAIAKRLKDIVVAISDFTDEEKQRLKDACKENLQVEQSWGVAKAIYATFGPPKSVQPDSDDNVPF